MHWSDFLKCVFIDFGCFLLQRFTKNFFVQEKNPTIVNFPIKWVGGSMQFDTCVPW